MPRLLDPVTPNAPPRPAADPYPASPDLAADLARLHREQAEIDRRRAEELARLREVQDRD